MDGTSGLVDPLFCEQRGYHGPFANTERYNKCPGWEGFGDCLICGSSRLVPTETARRLAAEMRQQRASA